MFELFALSDAAGGAEGAGFGQYLLLGLVLGSLYALIALGYTMVYGIIELINFAHGDLFMLGSMLALQIAAVTGVTVAAEAGTGSIVVTVLLMLVVTPLFCAALNVGTDRLIYKPLRSSPKLTVIVSAIGVGFIFMNLGLFWKGATPVKFPDLIPDTDLLEMTSEVTVRQLLLLLGGVLSLTGLVVLARAFLPGTPRPVGFTGVTLFGAGFALAGVAGFGPEVVPMPFLYEDAGRLRLTWKDAMVLAVTVPVMVALTVFVKFTSLGKAMRATAQNPTAAQLMGINADRVIAATFAIGGALAGVASVVYGLYIKSVDYQMGFQNGLYAFTAAVLGGIGNIPGAVLGGLVIGVVGELGKAYLGAKWSEALIFGILIVILLFRPTGLLGARTREKV